jgi:transporter family protein
MTAASLAATLPRFVPVESRFSVNLADHNYLYTASRGRSAETARSVANVSGSKNKNSSKQQISLVYRPVHSHDTHAIYPASNLVTEETVLRVWYAYALLTILAWGLWGVFSKLAASHSKPRQVLLFQAVGALAFAILVLFLEQFRITWSVPGFTWAFLGGFFTFVGFLTFFAALDHQGKASTVVTLSALYPLVTIVLSIAFLHERLTLRQTMGIVFAVVASVLLA